ncbi:conserved hypothetical protein [Histoplasma capsulatum H143]|nr:conserved hypothetical protein [Histoplasma capsulatum H143]
MWEASFSEDLKKMSVPNLSTTLERQASQCEYRLSRSKPVQVARSYGYTSSPYIDTAEFLPNEIIQKQDIIPPWIEKEQRMAKDIERFWKQLRNDWGKHIVQLNARSLESQILRAQGYVAAEARLDNNGGSGSNGIVDEESAEGMDTEGENKVRIKNEGSFISDPKSPTISHPTPENQLSELPRVT